MKASNNTLPIFAAAGSQASIDNENKQETVRYANINRLSMKKQMILPAIVFIAPLSSFGQFSFIHISDLHISGTAFPGADLRRVSDHLDISNVASGIYFFKAKTGIVV